MDIMYDSNFLDEFRHPSTKILGSRTRRLEGKRVLLGITGSVAAFLSPQIARGLIREGATVIPVMSEAGLNLIGKDLMWWATGVEPITKITGKIEHVAVAGVMNKPVDMMLIAPCTTNTVAKLAAGIADTPVTLVASSLMGKGVKVQLLVVGHEDLFNSPGVKESIDKLEQRGVCFIRPKVEEGKAKVPPMDELLHHILAELTPKYLKDRRVIITGGPTKEYIDNVRFVTNGASGKSAIFLAQEAMLHGADVSLIIGESQIPVPDYLSPIRIKSTNEMRDVTLKEMEKSENPVVILSAAMADFRPDKIRKGKTKSTDSFSIKLMPTEKLSDEVKKRRKNAILVVYKAEWGVTKEVLIERAMTKMKKTDADMAIANDLSVEGAGFGTDTNKVLFVRRDGKIREVQGLKSKIAYEIINEIYRKFIK